MHTTANILIFNLAIIDFLISSLVDPFTIAGIKLKIHKILILIRFFNIAVFLGSGYFEKQFAFCKTIAAVCLLLCAASVLNIVFLAVNR
jgi:hypothetical protein